MAQQILDKVRTDIKNPLNTLIYAGVVGLLWHLLCMVVTSLKHSDENKQNRRTLTLVYLTGIYMLWFGLDVPNGSSFNDA